MINKLSMSPAFTSKVRVVYDSCSDLRKFYESEEMKKQLDVLAKNGKDDVVTIWPDKIHKWNLPQILNMQILKKENGQLIYDEHILCNSKDVISTYNSAFNRWNDEVSEDITVKKYLV